MTYARFASGYRAGGINTSAAVFDLPLSFGPDKSQSYEIGVKGQWLDQKLFLDASVYYIDWKDIQLSVYKENTIQAFVANAGQAKSQGVELSLEARPLHGLAIKAVASYDDAVLTAPFPAESVVQGDKGNRLPQSSRFSGYLSVDQDFPLGALTGFLGASLSYVGDRIDNFTSTGARSRFPGYAKVDVRAGGRYGDWKFSLFANNVTDRVTPLGLDPNNPVAIFYLEPRTVGLSIAKDF
jgi:outer membrane receptor protein involved in Fe transport